METTDVIMANIPGHGSISVTPAAIEMIRVFGGTLHAYTGAGGCRKEGLYFSTTTPRKFLECEWDVDAWDSTSDTEDLFLSVSHQLAPKLDGAVLDFGRFNKMERFVWRTLPAVKGPQCTCLRSMGAPAGKRSPCLDDEGTGLTNL